MLIELQLGPAVNVRQTANAGDHTQQATNRAAPHQPTRSGEKQPTDADWAECNQGEPDTAEDAEPASDDSTERGTLQGVLAWLIANPIALGYGHRHADVG